MAKKDFTMHKPELPIEAGAVEAFISAVQNTDATQEAAAEQPVKIAQDVKQALPGKTKEGRRDRRLQLLLTESSYNYLKAAAWFSRKSVNDYVNTLIEADRENNPDAEKAYKGDVK